MKSTILPWTSGYLLRSRSYRFFIRLAISLCSLALTGVMGVLPTHTTFGFFLVLAFMLIACSLSWGATEFPILGNLSRLNIPAGVNTNDKGYHKAYKRFLARLVQARREADLTQVAVAKRLGKAHSFVSKCELGERRVDFVELQQLATIYKKDILFFRD